MGKRKCFHVAVGDCRISAQCSDTATILTFRTQRETHRGGRQKGEVERESDCGTEKKQRRKWTEPNRTQRFFTLRQSPFACSLSCQTFP